MTIKEISNLIIQSRINKTGISILPSYFTTPSSSSSSPREGYKIQNEIIQSKNTLLGSLKGWKIGATNQTAQNIMGFGPFYGPLFDSNFITYPSSSSSSSTSQKSKNSNLVISLSDLGVTFKAAEAEIAIKIKEDIPIRSSNQEKYTSQDILNKVDYALPAIEFASSRFTSNLKLNPAAIVADFAFNGCVILNEENQIKQEDLRNNIQQLAEITTQLDVNNTQVVSSLTSNVLGNPINALTWLINELNSHGQTLLANQIIITGAAFQYREIQANDKLTFHFNNFNRKNVVMNVDII